MAQVGIVPGEDFTFDALDSSTPDALERAAKSAYAKTKDHSYHLGTENNGWSLPGGHLRRATWSPPRRSAVTS